MDKLKSYTVNVEGNKVKEAKGHNLYAYYANGITAIEIKAYSKSQAKSIIKRFAHVLYVFE